MRLLEARLREGAHCAGGQTTHSGLRLDQAAAIWRALTSPRTVEVIAVVLADEGVEQGHALKAKQIRQIRQRMLTDSLANARSQAP